MKIKQKKIERRRKNNNNFKEEKHNNLVTNQRIEIDLNIFMVPNEKKIKRKKKSSANRMKSSKICRNYPNCSYGSHCIFAHISEQNLEENRPNSRKSYMIGNFEYEVKNSMVIILNNVRYVFLCFKIF